MQKILKKITYIFFIVVISLFAAYSLKTSLEAVDWYRYKVTIGLTGVFFILISFIYSIVKRFTKIKNKLFYLRLHIFLAILGTIIVFAHASLNHYFIFPILTYCFLFIVYSSGFVGSLLVRDVKREMEAQRENPPPLYSLIVIDKAVSAWRTVHIPLVIYWFTFLVIHVTSTFYYSGLRY